MNPFDNPFPKTDKERHALWEAHMRVDIDAFIAGDWDAVADDFDASSFCALHGNNSDNPADWTIGFPNLSAYRDTWLRMSDETKRKANPDLLRKALFSGARIQRLDFFDGDTAIIHKVFDGRLPLKDGGSEPYSWQSVFTLRKLDQKWKVVSFVGYMAATEEL